ncbi:MAG: beta-mannosidase [Oscillospiraceae bacterium]|nr:beta-mannosidase [Oscillospiraceae bacterium]
MKKNKFLSLVAAVTAMALTGCGGAAETADTETVDKTSAGSETSAVTSAAAETSAAEPIKAVYGEIRTEFADIPDLSAYPLSESGVPDGYSAVYEAESAELSGNCKVVDNGSFSGGSYVSGLNSQGDKIVFNVDIEYDGMYDLNFVCYSGDSGRVNYVYIDGVHCGDVICNSDGLIVDSLLRCIYLEKGSHEIALLPSWGYADYDCLKITPGTAITEDTYKVTAELSNPNADENTRRLYKFLCDIYGKYSLTGQFADKGRSSSELERIKQATGKEFAVLGLDMMDYSIANKANGANGRAIEYAYDWYENAGGIVQFCWHWNSPGEYAKNDADHPWYSSFYKEGSNIDLDRIMNGEDPEGYDLLMSDIDGIAQEFVRLRDSGVPIIWRPLHEAAGGWFWWGNCEPESYKKLWNEMYDKMTNEYGLTNLIWMWNGQDAEWYPGDDTVDIVSWDIYAGNHVYTSFSGTFAEAALCSSESKLIALSENGCVMDPDLVMRDNARWLFWGTWASPFTLKDYVLNEEYTEKEMLIKAYNHERTLTLDELPDLKNYPLDQGITK